MTGASRLLVRWLRRMQNARFEIRLETEADAPALSELSARAFGPGRFTRTAYRIRETTPPVPALCLTGWLGRRLIAGIRFTPLEIGGANGALLLGPLVVDPAFKGQGYGKTLVDKGLTHAREEGYSLVILVGDMPYYGRFGFAPVPFGQITLPGPVDPARLLAFELKPGSLKAARGPVLGAGGKGCGG
jgi:predicted N-acetyltransferase YhbS